MEMGKRRFLKMRLSGVTYSPKQVEAHNLICQLPHDWFIEWKEGKFNPRYSEWREYTDEDCQKIIEWANSLLSNPAVRWYLETFPDG